MILHVTKGTAGQTVQVTCGEALSGDKVESDWGWVQQWTLRDGEQTLEQHKYMECRFVQLTFSGQMAQSDFQLSAWKTHYQVWNTVLASTMPRISALLVCSGTMTTRIFNHQTPLLTLCGSYQGTRWMQQVLTHTQTPTHVNVDHVKSNKIPTILRVDRLVSLTCSACR